MEFIHLIREKQLELMRLYHLETQQKDFGVMLFRKDKNNNAQVIFYPLESIKSTYIIQRLRAMILDMEGKKELKLHNRMLITLPQFDELPEGIDSPKVMYFCIVDGKDGRLFQLIPQTAEVDGKVWYYYQMIADPMPDEMENPIKDNNDNWTVGPTEDGRWFKQACLLSVSNEHFFKSFRSAKEFREIIGNEDEAYGEELAKEVAKYDLGDIRNYRNLDEIGQPLTYYYPSIDCELSPTTLRYMKTLIDIGSIHDDISWLDDKKIIEIGGGYGGLCSVISQAVDFEKYTLVEIDPVIKLAKRYLQQAITLDNVDLMLPKDVSESSCEWDLLISEYAFCELDEEGIDFYLTNVFPRVNACFLGMNIWEEVRKNYIVNHLKDIFTTVTELPVTPEHPQWKRYLLICHK